ncbi:tRNA (adenosine(37)-N6)-threonylcarbamoyltransferase complex ATPase subunit type 1 TsaE [Immundisolibacter sp.]|uniref:tRNA (adenosine(37)-N6)-threonylcarbamoyltransferase complex ATPase subunit type 1 TsaE n=1 Tax=Immundisolibacter sp. TaxID=1934948 RepID=UPI002601CC63|nr:tRNA (adenosine(37)-N6)-threonylcarbamoyltransferase complex ATPase subunit type 1 TsaE [Immundisolibacter sp.]MDD3652530.1 tRNA (adenosine(37)-N6)-threonylcarbamoyltransferase complex ATPase subunit type 1 TsaE [Immundisolibacter sp.]
MQRSWMLEDEAAQLAFGARLAHALTQPLCIYLTGPLGAGKTTLVRGLLRALGHTGTVRSTTYTLLETYTVAGQPVCHFDLYRLTDAEELEHIGARELFDGRHLCLIEWPEHGAGWLPVPDLELALQMAGSGRRLRARAHGPAGERTLEALT